MPGAAPYSIPRPQRMMVVRISVVGWVLVLAALAPHARAQGVRIPVDDPGLHRDTLDAAQPQPFLLRPFVLPGSEEVRLGAALLDTAAYVLDYRYGRLWLRVDSLSTLPGPLVATYRTLPFGFRDVYRRRSLAAGPADSTGRAAVVEEQRAGAAAFDPFGADTKLQRSGSITRGILAGNNRDVQVESGLRLQLAGEITDGVDVQAVLTDENTPILPEGTTQRLDEFDRVFIQIEAPVGTAQLGDFDLNLPATEFARFNRKLQGITAFTDVPGRGALFGGGHVLAAGATSRGIFRTQPIEALEGVQGPYRLEGAAGERFIIVVPGSEVVYLDGVRLTRGETNDYVIDYATAEITFTPNRLITSDRRITVEFQYSTNQFTRTLVGTQAAARLWQRRDGTARARFGTTYLREADSRQFGAEFGLTPEDSLLLVGDEGGEQVLSRGEERVVFDPEAPFTQYVRAVPPGFADSAFVALTAAPADTVPVYRVRFSRVGQGQGSYARRGQQLNGIVYEYVGRGQGDYDPVRVLPRPKEQQLLDLHGDVSPLPGLSLFGEWAQSVYDQNRLSVLDGADDLGHAYLAGLRLQPTRIAFGEVGLGRVSGEVRRRVTGARFTPFDRIRPVEFERQWNLSARPGESSAGLTTGRDERIDEGFVQLDVTPRSQLRFEGGQIALGQAFRAERREAVLRAAEPRLPQLDYRVTYITSRDTSAGVDGLWLRQLGTLRQPLLKGRLVPSVEVEHERRRQQVLGADSLARPSFTFVEVRPGVTWTAPRLEAGAELELRDEDEWAAGTIRDASRAWTLQTRFKYRPNNTFSTDANVGYRVLRFTEYFRTEQQRQDNASVVMRWTSRFQPLRRAVDVNWAYEALTERTPTLQEIYVRTGPELGQYVWEDADGDGIVEIQEMTPERTPNEGLYALTYVPSDELVPAINVDARLRLELDPSRLWPRPSTRWQRVLSKVTSRTTVDVDEKSRNPNLRQIYLLDLRHFRDTTYTINGRLRLAQELSFFRSEPRYGLDLAFNQLRGLQTYTADTETRFLNAFRAEARYRPGTRWGTKLLAALERNRVVSDTFSTRQYDIEGLRLEPELSFQPWTALQLLAGLNYARKQDVLKERAATLLKAPLEARYARARRFQLTARGEVAHVRVTGESEGLAEFELTDGRGPGTSFLWNVTGNYALNQYLRATFSYDGRDPSDAPVIHTVRLQLSAVF